MKLKRKKVKDQVKVHLKRGGNVISICYSMMNSIEQALFLGVLLIKHQMLHRTLNYR